MKLSDSTMLSVMALLSLVASGLCRFIAQDYLFSYLFFFMSLTLMIMAGLARSFRRTTDKLRQDLEKLQKVVKTDGKDV